MSTIGSRIKDRRIELGMSADDVAEKLGKNRATIYRYESDEIENFPIQVIANLAEVLQVTPEYLMGWVDEKPVAKVDNGLTEIAEIFTELSPDNRAKLLELSRLYLDAQRKSEESK